MAKMVIPEGKKRIQITVTEDDLIEFKKLVKKNGFSRSFLSNFLDRQIKMGVIFLKGLDKAKMAEEVQLDLAEYFLDFLEKQKQQRLF